MSTTNATPADLAVMLDELGLSVSALRWRELLGSPEYSDFTPEQLLREVIEPQYIETMNNRYKTNLRLRRLIVTRARWRRILSREANGGTTTTWCVGCCPSALWRIG